MCSKNTTRLGKFGVSVGAGLFGGWLGTLLGALSNHFGYRDLSAHLDFPIGAFVSIGLVIQVLFAMLLYAPGLAACYWLLARKGKTVGTLLPFLYFLSTTSLGSARWPAEGGVVNGLWRYIIVSLIPVVICLALAAKVKGRSQA